MSEEPLIPTFVPPLVAVLASAERKKGSPLTRDEVTAERDRGVCIMLRQSEASKMAAARGYEDIDPEQAWEQWQTVRHQLAKRDEPTQSKGGRFRFLAADTALDELPTDLRERHEAFVEMFGRQVFSLRNEVLERTRAAIEAPQEDRDRMGTIHSKEYTAVAQLPTDSQVAALDLSRKAVDSFLRHLLVLFTYNGLSTDLTLGTEHVIAYEILLKVIRKDSLEPVETHAVNKDGQKVFAEYYGRWLNRYKDE